MSLAIFVFFFFFCYFYFQQEMHLTCKCELALQKVTIFGGKEGGQFILCNLTKQNRIARFV